MTALITASRAKCARLCARKHHLEYVQGYRPVETSEDLAFGTIVHEALAAWWCHAVPGIDVEQRLVAAQAALEATDLDPYVKVRALTMITGYHARWKDEPYTAVAVEQGFSGPLINPDTGAKSMVWQLAGKVDVIVADAEGRKWLMEHKTSSEDLTPGGTYWRRLRMDTQVSVYFDGAALLGHEVVGCIYDVLAKHKQRPLKATPEDARKFTKDGRLYANQRASDETPEEYCARLVEAVTAAPSDFYSRIEVPRTDAELADARRDLWQQAQRLREDERLGRAPRNPDACMAYGRECAFLDVCAGMGSLDDPSKFRRLTMVHPELAGESSTTTTASSSKEESAA